VGPPFYQKLMIPFLIPFLLVMAIGPKLKWIKSNLENKIYLILFFITSIFLSIFLVKILKVEFLINTLLISSAFYLFFISLKDFLKKKLRNISQNISHFGFSLLVLSILFNNILSTEKIINLKIGQTFQSENININFEKIYQKEEQNYKNITGTFRVENSMGVVLFLEPELRIYNQPNIITSEADIKTSLWSDKFITMNIVQNQEYFNIRYQEKPLMIWIWISVVIISLGGLTSLLKKKYEN
jgi:cytochrome c-type biogenesis protein CcmF